MTEKPSSSWTAWKSSQDGIFREELDEHGILTGNQEWATPGHLNALTEIRDRWWGVGFNSNHLRSESGHYVFTNTDNPDDSQAVRRLLCGDSDA